MSVFDYNSYYPMKKIYERKDNFTTAFCQRSFGKTITLKRLLNEIYGLYHDEESKKINVNFVNTNLKGVIKNENS